MKRKRITAFAVVVLAWIGEPVVAQDMEQLLKKKYEIEQQRVDAEKQRAEGERRRAQAAASSTRQGRAGPVTPHEVSEGDALEGTDAKKCVLGSGVSIRVSGTIRPNQATTCETGESDVVQEPTAATPD